MKIWWPWKRKNLLSLFEKRIPWCGEAPDAKPPVLPSECPPHEGPHPKNAPGSFYVGYGECISCGAPHAVAPALMAWDGDPNNPTSTSHCYFKKQPNDSWELNQALDAIAVSCCGAFYYAGSDPEVLQTLRKTGNKHAIVRNRG